MTDQHKLLADLEKGHQANLILDQIEGRLDLMMANLHKEWENTKWDDSEGREAIWRQLHSIRELKRSFMNDLKSAKLAQVELEKLNG